MAGLASLTQSLSSTLNDGRAGFNIITLGEGGNIVAKRSLQYFPESLQDSKSVTYATRSVPGGSLPIYQWVSGGPRRISLRAVFTRDMDPDTDPYPSSSTDGSGTMDQNVDIRSAIIWLRSHIYPRYTSVSAESNEASSYLTLAPRQVILNIPHSGIGSFSGNLTQDSVLAYMMECGVEYVSFFPNGVPRIAHISLAFEETAQYNGVVVFPQTSQITDGVWDDVMADNFARDGIVDYGTNLGIKYYSIEKHIPSNVGVKSG
jgi:hypothetical protein